MASIFLNYRRSDATADAGRLRDHLAQRFGGDLIFQDLNSISPGQRFPEVLDQALQRCEVFLPIIGPTWLATLHEHGRGSGAEDWVRTEIAKALSRPDVTVIPVLVRNAPLPRRDELPDDLKPLLDLEVCELGDKKWRRDVEDLIAILEKTLKVAAQAAPPVKPARRHRILQGALAAAGVLAIVLWSGVLHTQVPDVTGKPIEAARTVLQEQSGLRVSIDERDDDAPYGQVVYQNPRPGGYLDVPTITLGVSRGRPDLARWTSIREAVGENSGAGMAMATAMETSLAFQLRPRALSARYLVEKAKDMDPGKEGTTTYLSAVTRVAQLFGAPAEESWPYRDYKMALPPNRTWAQLDAEAAAHKSQIIRLSSYADIPGHLRRGRPVIASVDVYDKSWIDQAPPAKPGEIVAVPGRPDGKHSIVIVGFDDRDVDSTIRFANVWGKQWGDRGFGTMNADVARSMLDVRDMWAVEVLPKQNP